METVNDGGLTVCYLSTLRRNKQSVYALCCIILFYFCVFPPVHEIISYVKLVHGVKRLGTTGLGDSPGLQNKSLSSLIVSHTQRKRKWSSDSGLSAVCHRPAINNQTHNSSHENMERFPLCSATLTVSMGFYCEEILCDHRSKLSESDLQTD